MAAGLITLSGFSQKGKISVEWLYKYREEKWNQGLIRLKLSSVPIAMDIKNKMGWHNELCMCYKDLSLGNNGVTVVIRTGSSS